MKHILILISLTLCVFGCKKSSQTNPGNTDTTFIPTKNVMTSLVNGEKRIYSGKPTLSKGYSVLYFKYGNDSSNYFTGNDSKYNDHIMLEIFTWTIELNKKYEFGNEVRRDYAKYVYNSAIEYKTKLNTGYVIFTQYTDVNIAGSFAFTAYTKDSQKVEVTDGYFNIDRD